MIILPFNQNLITITITITKRKKKSTAANKEDSHDNGKQTTLHESNERMKPYTHGSQQRRAITESVTHFMAKKWFKLALLKNQDFLVWWRSWICDMKHCQGNIIAKLCCHHYIQKHMKEWQRNSRKLSIIQWWQICGLPLANWNLTLQ